MAHEHHHHGSSYYLDQLCTIAACGALGVVAIMMAEMKDSTGNIRLSYILAPQFFAWVLAGGIALLILSAVRAICLWQEAGEVAGHNHAPEHHHHEHEHAHEHAHEHEHHHHEHEQGHEHHDHGHEHHHHDHGWTPARYAVLMLPIVLFFLNMPNSGFSLSHLNIGGSKIEGGDSVIDVADKGGKVIDLAFKELSNAALVPEVRSELEGKTGRLKGMYSPLGSDKEFTLFRVKMNCCAADAIPLEVRIISPENITRIKDKQWVQVEGQIQFRKLAGKDKYIPVLQLKSASQVQKIEALSEYEF